MMHFYKTQRGIEVLQDRSIPLTARQRRLLVLIGSQDFNLLNDGLKQQLAPAELLDQLYAMDLIIPAETGEVAISQKQADARTDTKVDLAHSEIHRSLNSSIAADSATKDFTPEMESIKILQNTPSAETDSSHDGEASGGVGGDEHDLRPGGGSQGVDAQPRRGGGRGGGRVTQRPSLIESFASLSHVM